MTGLTFLLHLSARGTVVFAIVALLDRLCAARTAARTRRSWWLLVPVAFSLALPLPLPLPWLSAVVAGAQQRIPEPWVSSIRLEAQTGLFLSTTSPSPGPDVSIGTLLARGITAGTVVYLLIVLVRTRLAARRWGHERLSTDPRLLEVLEDCKAVAGITAPIGLVVSGSVAAPVLLGWLRPRLLLSRGLAASLSREQLRGVLFHELAHFRAWDVPATWLFTLVCATHWFNPAAHLALRAWTVFREEAADEAAIVWLGQPSGVAYGETLLPLRRTTPGPPAPFAALAIVESVSQLRKRITMIKHYEHKAPRYLLTGAIFATVALGFILRPVRGAEPPSSDPKVVANGVMLDWLKEMDDGKYEQSWKDASPEFQQAITSEKGVAQLGPIRKTLGRCTERKLASASAQSNLPSPSGPKSGDFILAQFETSFEGLKYTVETVTFVKTADGTWKGVGYYVKPK